jgi:stringent starvation protein B
MVEAKPYLIRGLHEWILDNHFSPYLLVDCTNSEIEVPSELIKDNEIVLNIAESAVQNLRLSNEFITFSARFDMTSHNIYIPMDSVKAIFAQENNQGMWFEVNTTSIPADIITTKKDTPKNNKLKLV